MRIITIPQATATFKLGEMFKDGVKQPLMDSMTFLEWLEELAHNTKEFGTGPKGAKRMRRISRAIDDAEEKKAETITLADDDYESMKTALATIQYTPVKADAVLDFMETFEAALDQKGPA